MTSLHQTFTKILVFLPKYWKKLRFCKNSPDSCEISLFKLIYRKIWADAQNHLKYSQNVQSKKNSGPISHFSARENRVNEVVEILTTLSWRYWKVLKMDNHHNPKIHSNIFSSSQSNSSCPASSFDTVSLIFMVSVPLQSPQKAMHFNPLAWQEHLEFSPHRLLDNVQNVSCCRKFICHNWDERIAFKFPAPIFRF